MDQKTTNQKTTPDPAAIAAEILDATAAHRSIAPFSSRPGGLSAADAAQVAVRLRDALVARGERLTGRKIGFTNRTIWPEYNIYAPNWGWVTDHTTRDLTPGLTLRAADFVEPKLEPEIMFGLARAPALDMDERALIGCVDWVALGYEVVQSIYPGWTFAPADTKACNAMHGALLVGPRHTIAPRGEVWIAELAAFTAELSRDGTVMDRGAGANVLDSPLLALRHLVQLLADDPLNPPLAAGEVVSTGTVTRALPVKAGETWTASVRGLPLAPVTVAFA
jgi:2-oxo-3-hexenedioate decarboxylase